MGKIFPGNWIKKQAGVAVLIFAKRNFKPKLVRNDKDVYFILIKENTPLIRYYRGLVVKNIWYCYITPKFVSQNPHDNLPPFITPYNLDVTSLLTSKNTCMPVVCRHTLKHTIYAYNEIFKRRTSHFQTCNHQGQVNIIL